jgi:hypothetical protein
LKTAFVYTDRDLECDDGWSHHGRIPEALAPDLAPARTLRDPALVSERQENCRQRMKEVLDCLERNLLPIHERSK